MDSSRGDNHDPAKYGPGYWHRLTKMAWEARTPELIDSFCREMRRTAEIFPCEVCRSHCQKYLQANPPEKFRYHRYLVDGSSLMLGMFVWIWQFHNAVNQRLGKPFYSFEKAVQDQTEVEQCSLACAASAVPNTTFLKINSIKP